MTNITDNAFKKIYYGFAFFVFFFAAVLLAYFLIFVALPQYNQNKTAEITPSTFDTNKTASSTIDEETSTVNQELNNQDEVNLDKETLSDLQ